MKYIFLDLDGTLIDSSKGIYKSFCYACEKNDLLPPVFEDFISIIGPPINVMLYQIFPYLNTKTSQKIVELFREDYDNNSFNVHTWYEKAETVLRFLKDNKNLGLAIITNKPTRVSEAILKEKGFDKYISVIIGIDYKVKTGGKLFKKKYEALKFALNYLNIMNHHAIYVGDTLSDKHNSEEAGIKFIAATYGFHHWEKHQLPKLFISKLEELIKIMENIKF